MSQRKNQLKKWFIDNPLPAGWLEAAAQRVGVQVGTMRCYPYTPTMPQAVHDEYVRLGVPAHLLPPITRPKSELIRENRELIRRLAKYEPEYVAQIPPTGREARA